jgi:hypothetical protein
MGIVGKRSGSITFRDRELINLSIDRWSGPPWAEPD